MENFYKEQKRIESLRQSIGHLSLLFPDDISKEAKHKKKIKNKNKKKKANNSDFIISKINNKIIMDDCEEQDDIEMDIDKLKEIKEKELSEKNRIQVDKNFENVYNNIYCKDLKYYFKKKTRLYKEVHYDSIEYRPVFFPKKKKYKFDFNDIYDTIERNDHQMRYEAEYEDEFISSDSYDTDLINIKNKVNKNYIIKTKQSLIDNKDNLIEINKVIKLCKRRDDDGNSRIRMINNNNDYI